MAKLVEYYYCPACNSCFDTEKEATQCRNQHPVRKMLWAESKSGKGCLVAFYGSEERALFEADLPDNIVKRKKRLEELIAENPEKCRRLGYFNVSCIRS